MAAEAAFAAVLFAFLLIPLFFLSIIAIAILLFVFWIMMLIDSIQREYKNDSDKIVWVIVIVFAQLIGAIIYYFVVKAKDKKQKKK